MFTLAGLLGMASAGIWFSILFILFLSIWGIRASLRKEQWPWMILLPLFPMQVGFTYLYEWVVDEMLGPPNHILLYEGMFDNIRLLSDLNGISFLLWGVALYMQLVENRLKKNLVAGK